MVKKITLIVILFFTLINLFAKDNFNERFVKANTLMELNKENLALPIWLDLLTEDPYNCNLNYKIGFSYLKSSANKSKSLSYLIMASYNITKNYDPRSPSEHKSPIESVYYMANAYHLNNMIDSAIANYTQFINGVNKDHKLVPIANHKIEQCKYAKIAIKSPVNIEILNLGNQLNSKYDDYSPVISLDESALYFTSRRVRKDSSNAKLIDFDDGKFFEDIYVSYKKNDTWGKAELIDISTEEHEATLNVAIDGQSLFAYKDEDIYIATTNQDDEWSKLTKMGENINSQYIESHAHVSPDEQTLYFVSDKKDGLGGKDIYLCKRLPNGEWAKSQNIGSSINTPYNEDGVFIHPDGKTIYFSSEGHTSIGGYDIFSSSMDDEGNWSEPVNLGYPINTTDHDVFFVTSTDGKRGYYSSFNKNGFGGQDIYQIALSESAAKPVTLLNGYIRVEGQENLPDNAIVTVYDNNTGILVGEYRPRRRDGKFNIILNPGINYHIKYAAADFSQEEDLFIPLASAYQEIQRGIDLEHVVFSDYKGTMNESIKCIAEYKEFFAYNKNTIDNSNVNYNNLIAKAIESAKINGKVKISIESSASHVPTKFFKSNAELASKRAHLNMDKYISRLNSMGVSKENIIILSINSKVRGPKYKSEYAKNEVYNKYQYVTIRVH